MTEHLVLYVLGEPGIGKTSLVRFLLRDALFGSTQPTALFTEPPNPKWTIAANVLAAGHYKGSAFDGADTIPYNGARAALEYWRDQLLPDDGLTILGGALTILDGARFATKPSLAFLRETPNVRVIGVHLVGPVAAVERRAKRCADNDTKPQDASWVKGASTGARNFAALIQATDIDATQNALVVAGEAYAVIGRTRTKPMENQ